MHMAGGDSGSSGAYGGGLVGNDLSLAMASCRVESNTALSIYTARGGGAYWLTSASKVVSGLIQSTTFRRNTAKAAGYLYSIEAAGGGLYFGTVTTGSYLTLRRVTLVNNRVLVTDTISDSAYAMGGGAYLAVSGVMQVSRPARREAQPSKGHGEFWMRASATISDTAVA
jgi:hypothetical protein